MCPCLVNKTELQTHAEVIMHLCHKIVIVFGDDQLGTNSINREAYGGLFFLFLPGMLRPHRVMYMSAGGVGMKLGPHGPPDVPWRGSSRGSSPRRPKQVSEPVIRIEFPETWLWAHTDIGYLDMRLSFDWLSALLIIVDASHDCMFRLTLASFLDVLIS